MGAARSRRSSQARSLIQPGFSYERELLTDMWLAPFPDFYVEQVLRGVNYYHPGQHVTPYGEMPSPFLLGELIISLAHSPPHMRRNMLGEKLYPCIEALVPDRAAKITGMLLEMPPDELLYLLASQESMRTKVLEALNVLRDFERQELSNPADQLPASLDD